MKAEVNALDKASTWKVVDLPSNIKHIGCKWAKSNTIHMEALKGSR